MRTRSLRASLVAWMALLVAAFAVVGCATADGSAKSPIMASHEARRTLPGNAIGAYRMAFDEFHSLSRATLQRSAVPWKALGGALLAHHRRTRPDLPMTETAFIELLQRRYGFLVPRRVANWPASEPQPVFRRPLGMMEGTLRESFPRSELDLTNLGCATCHSGNLYDATGAPVMDAWLGLPSGSIDLGRFGDEVYLAFGYASRHIEETIAIIRQAFPDVSAVELETLRAFYLPQVSTTMDRLDVTLRALTPHSNGSPGLTNGVATLKLYLGAIDGTRRDPTQVAFTSIPDLDGLRVRPSILWDGIYAPPGWAHTGPLPAGISSNAHRDAMAGVVSLVTIGTTGVTPEVAATNVARMRDVVGWIMDDYRPPPFPGPIDRPRAERGAVVYARDCASCHGEYHDTGSGLRLMRFPNRIVPTDVLDTDPVRADAPGRDPNALFARTAMGRHLHARNTGGYVAVPLTSLWATAPYLHNGSVPTLWHLMHPETRPTRFQVGGHRMNFDLVGIDGAVDGTDRQGVYRYPPGYRPWMDPEVYDTRAPGRSNTGHGEVFDGMPEDDKAALLEYLKRV